MHKAISFSRRELALTFYPGNYVRIELLSPFVLETIYQCVDIIVYVINLIITSIYFFMNINNYTK